ncbi:protein kinase [Planctomycetota bacterium]
MKLIASASGMPDRVMEFTQRSTCIVGRSADCQIQIASNKTTQTVSRYHCLIEVSPPQIYVRDFGSLNGTLVNGQEIGKRHADESIEDGRSKDSRQQELSDGDVIQIAGLTLSVAIEQAIPETVAFPSIESRESDPVDALKKLLEGPVEEKEDEQPLVEGYPILRKLGEGGMGLIYLARDQLSNAKAVIKVMHPRVAMDEWNARSFLREARNSQAVKHENIVEVKQFGKAEDFFYIVLEYCNLGSVAQLIRSHGPLEVNVAIPIIRHILNGLVYAHQVELPNVRLGDGTDARAKGLVHRDLSPENLLLQRQNGKESRVRAKIADFGLSKAFDLAGLSGFTNTGTYAGKPYFVCRQQVLNYRNCKPEVDVWAAAASLYFMLTGSYPREFHKDKDAWLTVLKEKPIPIRSRRPQVPKRLASLIDAALEDRNDELHFESAAEFQSELSGTI